MQTRVKVAIKKAFNSVKKLFFYEDQVGSYLNCVERFLGFALSVLNPFVTIEGERKLSRRVVGFNCVQILGLISSIAYAIERFSTRDNVKISEKAELVAMALLFTRNVCYAGSCFIFGVRTEANIQRIIEDRKLERTSTAARLLARDYSKREFVASTAFLIYFATALVLVILSPNFMPNRLCLVYNFKILLLPFDEIFSVNWYLSYFVQICIATVASAFYSCFVPLTLYQMNRSCWELDNLKIQVEELCCLSRNHGHNDHESKKSAVKKIKEIIRNSYSVMEWQNEVQDLLKFIFLLDFSLQAIMTGLGLATLSIEPKASLVVYVLPLVVLPQLFAICWMAERCVTRTQKLTAVIYDLPWYLMSPKQQKELQIVLMMSQNMRGYNGIFYEVNMETFTRVLNLTYSFFTLLRSMHFYHKSFKRKKALKRWQGEIESAGLERWREEGKQRQTWKEMRETFVINRLKKEFK